MPSQGAPLSPGRVRLRFGEKDSCFPERKPCQSAPATLPSEESGYGASCFGPFPPSSSIPEETPMITISETATHELEAYFADKEKTPIRVYLAAGG